MKLKTLLVATDLSDDAPVGYTAAADLARITGARVRLLHVDELGEQGFRDSQAMVQWLGVASRVREARLREAEATFDAWGLGIEVIEQPGSAASVILATAARADMIVLTRHGRSGLGPLGSTCRRVVRDASVPVLVAHAGAAAEDSASGPDTAGGRAASSGPLRRVVVATDFSDASTRGAQAAARYAAQVGGSLHLVHVWRHPGASVPVRDDELPTESGAWLAELQRAYQQRFDDWLVEVGIGAVSHEVFPGDSPAVGLIAAAITWGADVIALPATGKGAIEAAILGSTVERLLAFSPLPVLVFPRGWAGIDRAS